MMRSRRKERGRRTQQRRSRGAEAAEKGERLFCPAVKTCKSSPTTRRTKKKEEAGGDGEQRRRWRARRSGEKRERYSEAFCERAAPCHAAPRQAKPCSVPSHAAVRSTAVAELSRRGAPRRNCQGRGALLACACACRAAWRGDTLTGVSSTAVAHSLRGDGANSQRAVARHYAGAATRDEAH